MRVLNTEEVDKLRKHLQMKVKPRLRDKTVESTIEKVQKIRTGEMTVDDWVNEKTKIIPWWMAVESLRLYKFVYDENPKLA